MKNHKTILTILLFGTLSLSLYSCKNKSTTSSLSKEKADVKNSISSFEERFAQTLSKNETKNNLSANDLSADESVRLIGFQTIYIPKEDRQELKKLLLNNKNILSRQQNNFYAEDGSFFRIYFPLHTAIVSYKGENYNANEYGLVNIKGLDTTSIHIIGRKKSTVARGTGSNKILSSVISLKQMIKPSSIHVNSKVMVVDLGERSFGNNGHSCWSENFSSTYSKAPRIKAIPDGRNRISCYANHGNKNCSTAFNIHGGRCTFSSTACMDFNGWFTNCVRGRKSAWRNFLGSDCNFAMGAGHCWNEI